MRIADIMSHPVACCGIQASLREAAQLMWERDCGAVAVIDQDGRLTGIVTDRDICMAALTQGRHLEGMGVGSAMAKQVFSCGPDDAVEPITRMMGNKQVRRVPVVDADNRPIGMISMNDIVRDVAFGVTRPGSERDVVRSLASISAPRGPQQAATHAERPEPRATA